MQVHNGGQAAVAGESQPKRGYQFGDLFLNKLIGKDKYEFGDVSRFIDGKVKEAACQLTGKDRYEFGDISRLLDQKAKDQVCKFTGKGTYEFGDISKEIARRVREGEVDPEDMSLLLRVLVTSGIGLTPVAHLLPVQLLVSLLGWNLQAEVGHRVNGALARAIATELDRRAKGVILGEGNDNYVLGDLSRVQLQKAIRGITGKDSYEFGDISKAALRGLHASLEAGAPASGAGPSHAATNRA